MAERPRPVEGESPWRWAGWVFGLLALVAVVALSAHLGDVEHFLRLLRSIAPWWLLLALILQAGTYLAVASSWWLGLRCAGSGRPFRVLARLALGKLFIDQAVPSGGMSGTAFLVTAIVRRGVAAPAALATLLADLVGHYAAYLATALIGLAVLWSDDLVRPWTLVLVAVFAIVSLAIPAATLSLHRLRQRQIDWMRRIPGARSLLEAFVDAPTTLLHDVRLVLALGTFNAAVIVLDAATLWAMLQAIGEHPAFGVAFASFVLAMMVAMLGPIPMGLGTFEATCTTSLVLMGEPIEAALTATLLLRGLTTWLPMLPGLVIARREFRAGRAGVRQRARRRKQGNSSSAKSIEERSRVRCHTTLQR